MTSTVAVRSGCAGPAPLLGGYRFEVVKLVSQWRIRVILVACWIAPAVFVSAASTRGSLPTDTVFGRWVSATGWAGCLVVLAFSCTWALPLLTSLVAGDVFSTEDRLGTWRHLLIVVGSQRRIFAAKVLASVSVILLLVVGLAASAITGGLATGGVRPLVGLDGHLLTAQGAAGTVLLAWATVLAPTLAFAAVGLLGSIVLGRSPMGLLLPALLALVLQLAQLLPLPVVVRLALPSHAFLAWRGFFTSPAEAGPLVIGLVVSIAWACVATALAYVWFVRRDFTDSAYDGSARAIFVGALLPLAAVLLATVAVISAVVPLRGSGLEAPKVERSLATAFAHLYRMQSGELHRPDVTEAQLRTRASCDKGGSLVADAGPGNDWRCVVSWHIPGAAVTGSAIYQLDVTADGRYVADGDGPKEVNGYFQVRTPYGDTPNPLWQFDGLVDLLNTPRKE